MGWRDRDYAKWTDEERSRFLGSPARGLEHDRSLNTRNLLRPGAGVAVIVSVALFGLGQLPRSHPILPALHINWSSVHPSKTAPTGPLRLGKIKLPTRAPRGSFLTITGQLPASEQGTLSIEGAYGRPPWQLLAAVPSSGRTYTARIRLDRGGLLHLRITYPDGHRAVGAMHINR